MNSNNSFPLVSICCITFNHEKYIQEAIESFLMQKTEFPIEIIIHDDASTDGTTAIIKEYANKYSDLVIPILQTENQYSKGIRPSATYVWPKARGKYIALCEGDDYWTDPFKLQKQVDILEKDPNCVLVYTDFSTIDENGNEIYDDFYTKWQKPRFKSGRAFWDMLERNFISTQTVLVRKDKIYPLINDVLINHKWYAIDRWWWLNILYNNDIKYLDIKTAKYRRHINGITYSGYIQKAKPHLEYDILEKYIMHGKIYLSKKNKSILSSKIIYLLSKPSISINKKFKLLKTCINYNINLIKILTMSFYYYIKYFVKKIYNGK